VFDPDINLLYFYTSAPLDFHFWIPSSELSLTLTDVAIARINSLEQLYSDYNHSPLPVPRDQLLRPLRGN